MGSLCYRLSCSPLHVNVTDSSVIQVIEQITQAWYEFSTTLGKYWNAHHSVHCQQLEDTVHGL
jgi:hypothetical protein